MHRKLDAGPLLVALGALVLAIALFLPWYGRPDVTAWEAFEILDLLLLALAGGAAFAALGRAAEDGGRVVLAAAVAALVIVAAQLIEPPPLAQGEVIEVGAWMALAASILMVLGAVLAQASISVTVDVRGRETRRRVAAVDRRTEAAEDGTDGEPAASAPASRTAAGGSVAASDAPTAPAASSARASAREPGGSAASSREPGGPAASSRRPWSSDEDPQRTQAMPAVSEDDEAR